MVDKALTTCKALVYNQGMKNIKQAVVILLLIVAPVAIYFLWPSDEARIRKLISAEVSAFEAKDMEAFLSGISFSYRDDRGVSYVLIKRVMEERLKRYDDIKISYSDMLIEVREDETATAVMDLSVTARGQDADSTLGYVLGGPDAPAVINLTLKKEGAGSWKIRSSKWPPSYSF